MFLPSTKRSFREIVGEPERAIDYGGLPWESFASLTKIDTSRGEVAFIPYDYQKEIIKLSREFSTIFLVKSRQMGATESVINRFLQLAIGSSNQRAVIFQNRQEDVAAVSGRIRKALIDLPFQTDSDTISRLEIKGRGKIYLKNSSKHGSRSIAAVSCFLFDEAAFSDTIEEIYAASSASSATVDKPTKYIISTPSSANGWFHDKLNSNNFESLDGILERVRSGLLPPFYWWVDKTGVCKVALHWSANPIFKSDKDFLEKRKAIDSTSNETIQREYNLTFVDSRSTVFNPKLLEPILQKDWRPSEQIGRSCFAALDTSPSAGNDYTVFTIATFVGDRIEILDYVRTNQGTLEYRYNLIADKIRKYKPYVISIESNEGSSRYYAEEISTYFRHIELRLVHINRTSKLQLIERLTSLIERKLILLPPIFVEELGTYKRSQNGSYGSSNSSHDDTVASLLCLVSLV